MDHPSQLQHQLCLFTSTDEWVELYIETALNQLDLYHVMEKWYPELQLMELHGSEKVQALHMWLDIRKKLHRHRADPRESWMSIWAERVKDAWNHEYP